MRESFIRRLILWGCSTRVVMLLALVAVIVYVFLALMSPGTLPNSRSIPRSQPISSQTARPIPATVIVTAIFNPLFPVMTPTFLPLRTKAPPRIIATPTPTASP